MQRLKYAVVRDNSLNKTFTKWHDTQEEALTEAVRLCREDGGVFFVIKLIGVVERDEIPIKKEMWG